VGGWALNHQIRTLPKLSFDCVIGVSKERRSHGTRRKTASRQSFRNPIRCLNQAASGAAFRFLI
jgi:hypothetical protein